MSMLYKIQMFQLDRIICARTPEVSYYNSEYCAWKMYEAGLGDPRIAKWLYEYGPTWLQKTETWWRYWIKEQGFNWVHWRLSPTQMINLFNFLTWYGVSTLGYDINTAIEMVGKWAWSYNNAIYASTALIYIIPAVILAVAFIAWKIINPQFHRELEIWANQYPYLILHKEGFAWAEPWTIDANGRAHYEILRTMTVQPFAHFKGLFPDAPKVDKLYWGFQGLRGVSQWGYWSGINPGYMLVTFIGRIEFVGDGLYVLKEWDSDPYTPRGEWVRPGGRYIGKDYQGYLHTWPWIPYTDATEPNHELYAEPPNPQPERD